MKNLGEGDMKGVSEDGVAIEFTAQVGEGVKKMLLSVKRACKSWNMIIFGADMKAIRELAKMDSIEDNVIGHEIRNQERNQRKEWNVRISNDNHEEKEEQE